MPFHKGVVIFLTTGGVGGFGGGTKKFGPLEGGGPKIFGPLLHPFLAKKPACYYSSKGSAALNFNVPEGGPKDI